MNCFHLGARADCWSPVRRHPTPPFLRVQRSARPQSLDGVLEVLGGPRSLWFSCFLIFQSRWSERPNFTRKVLDCHASGPRIEHLPISTYPTPSLLGYCLNFRSQTMKHTLFGMGEKSSSAHYRVRGNKTSLELRP